MLVEFLVGSADAESPHADECAIGADDCIPSLPDRCLDRNLYRCVAYNSVTRFGGSIKKQLETRHRNHPR